MEFCFIYVITNKLDGKKYCGYHITKKLNDNYFGSGVYLKRIIKKYGRENFDFAILENCSRQNILQKENEWIKKLNCRFPNGYNLTDGGLGSPGRIISEETRQKKRLSMLGKTHSEETKRKMSESHKGKIISKESIEKWKESHKGFKWPDEVKKKLSNAAKRNLTNPQNNPMYGKKHSEETKHKMSESHKKRGGLTPS